METAWYITKRIAIYVLDPALPTALTVTTLMSLRCRTWKRPGAQSHEESGCAVALSGHIATHVPAREGSKSFAHSLCDDFEKAGVKKLLAKLEEFGSAHESWSSTQLLCTWSRGPGRTRGTRCSAFAEKLHVFAAAADRHDLTLMQPLHSGSAFLLSTP